jgi:hypothetical protein
MIKSTHRAWGISRIALCGIAALASSCGLIDPDIADFDLSLPEKEVVVDTSQWQMTGDETLPALDCSQNTGICSAGIAQLCGAEGACFGSCNADQECDVRVLVNLWHSFDLAKEKPELEEIEGKPLVSVTINKIAYTVSENTMNIDTPEMTVYAAPAHVMSPGDPQAQAIGNIPAVPAGTTVNEADVVLTEQGKSVLAGFMKQYSTPFNVIVGTDVLVSPGDQVPMGKLTAVVLVTAVAGI